MTDAQRRLPRPTHDETVDARGIEGADRLAEVERVLDAVQEDEQRPLPHLGEQLVDRSFAPRADEADDAAVAAPAGQLLDPIGLDRVDDHGSLARQGAQPSEAPVAGADGPHAVRRADVGLEDGLHREVALDDERLARIGHLAQREAAGRRRPARPAATSSEATLGAGGR